MPSPIIFTPTPHDLDADNADATDAFSQVATTTDTNFNAVRTFFNGRAAVVATETTHGMPGGYTYVGQAWTAFPGGSWPAITIVVPKRPSVLLCLLGANVHNLGRSGQSWLAASFNLSGTGLTGWAPPATLTPYRVLADNSAIGSSVVWPVTSVNLVPGGLVTLTPMYFLNAPSAVADSSIAITDGHCALVCFA